VGSAVLVERKPANVQPGRAPRAAAKAAHTTRSSEVGLSQRFAFVLADAAARRRRELSA
jgi:hypothetical protein